MKCGIIKIGVTKSKNLKPLSKLLWLLDMKKTTNYMLISILKSCNSSEKPKAWTESESKFPKALESFFYKKKNSSHITMNFFMSLKNMKESLEKLSLSWNTFLPHILKTLNSNLDLVWSLLPGLQWILTPISHTYTMDSKNSNNSLLTLMILLKIVSKITLKMYLRLLLSYFLKTVNLLVWITSSLCKKISSKLKLISSFPKTSKSKELLMIFSKQLFPILWTLMLTPLFLKKLKE
jgi:hypothetical protein